MRAASKMSPQHAVPEATLADGKALLGGDSLLLDG